MTQSAQKTKEAKPKTLNAQPWRQEQLTKLLRSKTGATIPQLEKAFGWQPHSVRAAISRLRKDGLPVERSVSDNGAVYRVVEEA